MSVEEARQVRWPFRQYKGTPMGILLDNRSIVLKDLGYAVERAYDKRVRDASRVLLTNALTQVKANQESEIGPLNVVVSRYRSFAERRQMQLTLIWGAISGIFMGVLISIFVNRVFSLINRSSVEVQVTETSWLAVLLAIAIIGFAFLVPSWILTRFLDYIDAQIQRYRKGQLGEERALNAMYLKFDSDWWLFRNVELPGQRNGDIDFVLVGSSGIWAIETKALTGTYRNTGDEWQRKFGNRWVKSLSNPSIQAKKNATKLKHLLKSANINWVQAVVFWANPESALQVQHPSVDIWTIDNILPLLDELPTNKKLSPQDKETAISILKRFYSESTMEQNPD